MISPEDKDRIAQAIRAAEAKTAGEIFCVLAQHSSEYTLVPLAWACAVALVIPAPLIYLTLWPAWLIYAIQVIVFMIAALALSLPKIRFALVPRSTAHDRAHAEAMRQFSAREFSSSPPWPSAMRRSSRIPASTPRSLRMCGTGPSRRSLRR
jgi:putative membrane protein